VRTMGDRNRIGYIDSLRGILILLMVSTHSIGLASVSNFSIFKSVFWLPRGWAGESFVILSGFTIANILSWNDNHNYLIHRLWRRSWILFVVMFISNLASVLLQYTGSHELYKVMDFNWWIGLFSFRTEYTISAALLPISILLLVTPLLFVILDKVKLIFFILGTALFALFSWGINVSFSHDTLSTIHLMDVLFFTGAGGSGFPIFPLLSYGFIGFALGMVWKNYGLDLTITTVLGTASFFILLKLLNPFVAFSAIHVFRRTFIGISHFAIFLVLSVAIYKSRTINKALAPLAIIGESALFCFIIHRPILEVLVLVNHTFVSSTLPEMTYCLYFGITLVILILLCIGRTHFSPFNKSLKKFGL
jgi:hypothetical protein